MSASTWILCLQIILISIGAISIAITVNFSVPSIIDFAFYEIPAIWTTVVSWLKPPYIYFIVNGIIIIIAASSQFSFQRTENSENFPQTQPLISGRTLSQAHIVAATIPTQTIPEINVVESPPPPEMDNYEEEDEISESNIVELKAVMVNGIIEADEIEKEAYDDIYVSSPPVSGDLVEDRDLLVSRSACSSPRKSISPTAQLDYFPLPGEKKPLLPSRFGHRKPVKAVPKGGRGPRVAKPKRYETLESTWNKIMEGRDQQLNKSDTFDQNNYRNLDLKVSNHYENDDNLLLPQHVLKSSTFRDRTNYVDALPPARQAPDNWSSNLGKIKKELSIGQDELNRRVEAFIKKFNEDMRIQRQDSINKYMEKINRGAN